LGSLSLTLILNKRPWEIAMLITTGIMISIMCRIIFDGINDPYTQSFPFEIIAALISVPSAFIEAICQYCLNLKSKMTIINNG
jgi:hypothetical protein